MVFHWGQPCCTRVCVNPMGVIDGNRFKVHRWQRWSMKFLSVCFLVFLLLFIDWDSILSIQVANWIQFDDRFQAEKLCKKINKMKDYHTHKGLGYLIFVGNVIKNFRLTAFWSFDIFCQPKQINGWIVSLFDSFSNCLHSCSSWMQVT